MSYMSLTLFTPHQVSYSECQALFTSKLRSVSEGPVTSYYPGGGLLPENLGEGVRRTS